MFKKAEKKEEGFGTVIGLTAVNVLTGGFAAPFTARAIARGLNNEKAKKATKLAIESGDKTLIEAVTSSTKKTPDKATSDKKKTTTPKTTKKVVKKEAVKA